jgi:hypothetical protein
MSLTRFIIDPGVLPGHYPHLQLTPVSGGFRWWTAA